LFCEGRSRGVSVEKKKKQFESPILQLLAFLLKKPTENSDTNEKKSRIFIFSIDEALTRV